MFCEQNKSAQNGLAYKASNGNVDLTHEIQRQWKQKMDEESLACSSVRKLDRRLWTST